jgi:hypothetical protein
MAERRMFTKKVTDDDNFMTLSSSAQALYLHLSMSADDDGFCNQVSLSMFKAHASVQDLQALLEKRYIYQFENGVIVIKHWRMANALRKDRYTPTAFQEELRQLNIKENGSYTLVKDGESLENKGVDEDGCQVVAKRLPFGCHSIGKNSIDKISIEKKEILKKESDEIPDFDLEEAWKKIRDTYPKTRKNGMDIAKLRFLDLFKGISPNQYKDLAKMIARAVDLYKKDCIEQGDESFKYCPNMDKWLTESAGYWIEKAEEFERNRNVKSESEQ